MKLTTLTLFVFFTSIFSSTLTEPISQLTPRASRGFLMITLKSSLTQGDFREFRTNLIRHFKEGRGKGKPKFTIQCEDMITHRATKYAIAHFDKAHLRDVANYCMEEPDVVLKPEWIENGKVVPIGMKSETRQKTPTDLLD